MFVQFSVFERWKVLCSLCFCGGRRCVLCFCTVESIMFCVFVRWKVLCSVFRVPPVCWRQFSVILNKASEARRQQCTGDCL